MGSSPLARLSLRLSVTSLVHLMKVVLLSFLFSEFRNAKDKMCRHVVVLALLKQMTLCAECHSVVRCMQVTSNAFSCDLPQGRGLTYSHVVCVQVGSGSGL